MANEIGGPYIYWPFELFMFFVHFFSFKLFILLSYRSLLFIRNINLVTYTADTYLKIFAIQVSELYSVEVLFSGVTFYSFAVSLSLFVIDVILIFK